MARPLRLERAGALYQITYRGDGREDIFLTVDDRVVWLAPLAEACRRFNRVCHALLDDQAQRRVAKRALAEFANAHERNVAIALAYLSGQPTMSAIADHFGVHYTTVS